MLTERKGMQIKMHCITIENLVPKDHFLRKLENTVDFSFIYDEVRELYCLDNGRPGIDPVMLVKYLLVGYLYGIESERRIEQEIQVNMAYRWFLGLDLDDRLPDHSTISQNRRRRFKGQDLFRRLFERTLQLCIEKGLVDGKLILTDSTHVKANASWHSEHKIQVEKESAWYMEGLDRYEGLERGRLENVGKIPAKRIRYRKKAEPKRVEKRVSTTDPQAGLLNRPGKPGGMHYLDHQSVDAHKEKKDHFVCPMGKVLPLRRLQRSENNISREYRAESKDCKCCPMREKCLAPSQSCRRIQVNIFEAAVKENHAGDGSPEHKRILNLRQIWCERRFAAQKAWHNLRRLFRRGLEAAEEHCLLSATALNLKRMIKCMNEAYRASQAVDINMLRAFFNRL